MTCPPIWKWRPRIYFHRSRRIGWQIMVYQHTDHNPVVVIERWQRKWRFEFYRDRRISKKYGW